jgi:hypothetical protein
LQAKRIARRDRETLDRQAAGTRIAHGECNPIMVARRSANSIFWLRNAAHAVCLLR